MLRTCLIGLGLMVLPLAAQSDLPTLEGVVREWVDLETTWSAEAQAHTEAIAELERRKSLSVEETKTWKKGADQLERDMQEAARQEAELAKRLAKQADLEAALLPAITDAEARLRVAFQSVPAPLMSKLQAAQDRLAMVAGKNPVQRLQTVLATRQELAELNRGMHAVRWQKDDVMFDVLIAGLGCGWAVSPDNRRAAVIEWRDGEWVWRADDTIASSVRKAWESATSGNAGEVTPLPVQVKK